MQTLLPVSSSTSMAWECSSLIVSPIKPPELGGLLPLNENDDFLSLRGPRMHSSSSIPSRLDVFEDMLESRFRII
ncbi:hypothetical protein ACHAXS_007704 [Conticribra weissflogii]